MTDAAETYFDHAASAPLRPGARDAIVRALDLGPGNAGSSHAAGRRLRCVLEDAREAVAGLVGARPEQVVFTSGTTESNRLALRGLLGTPGSGRGVLVTTTAAHDGLRALALALAGEGVTVRTAVAGPAGHVAAADVVALAGDLPAVVALPLVESVTGARQPVEGVTRELPAARVHVDAAQAVARLPVSFRDLGAATLAFSAHKLGGPQGIGALVIRDDGLLHAPDGASSQERGRRAGTEAVALAAGFGAAAAAVRDELRRPGDGYEALLAPLRAFAAETPGAEVVTAPPAVPGVLLVRFANCPGDALLAALDARGVRVSTGTACASGARLPPHVLTAAGRPARDAAECVRVSVGWSSTEGEVRRLLRELRELLPHLRTALAGCDLGGEKKLSRSSAPTQGPSP